MSTIAISSLLPNAAKADPAAYSAGAPAIPAPAAAKASAAARATDSDAGHRQSTLDSKWAARTSTSPSTSRPQSGTASSSTWTSDAPGLSSPSSSAGSHVLQTPRGSIGNQMEGQHRVRRDSKSSSRRDSKSSCRPDSKGDVSKVNGSGNGSGYTRSSLPLPALPTVEERSFPDKLKALARLKKSKRKNKKSKKGYKQTKRDRRDPLIGQPAPMFNLPLATTGEMYTPPFGQKAVAIFFIPWMNPHGISQICTRQMCMLRDQQLPEGILGPFADELEIVAISADPITRQQNFIRNYHLDSTWDGGEKSKRRASVDVDTRQSGPRKSSWTAGDGVTPTQATRSLKSAPKVARRMSSLGLTPSGPDRSSSMPEASRTTESGAQAGAAEGRAKVASAGAGTPADLETGNKGQPEPNGKTETERAFTPIRVVSDVDSHVHGLFDVQKILHVLYHRRSFFVGPDGLVKGVQTEDFRLKNILKFVEYHVEQLKRGDLGARSGVLGEGVVGEPGQYGDEDEDLSDDEDDEDYETAILGGDSDNDFDSDDESYAYTDPSSDVWPEPGILDLMTSFPIPSTEALSAPTRESLPAAVEQKFETGQGSGVSTGATTPATMATANSSLSRTAATPLARSPASTTAATPAASVFSAAETPTPRIVTPPTTTPTPQAKEGRRIPPSSRSPYIHGNPSLPSLRSLASHASHHSLRSVASRQDLRTHSWFAGPPLSQPESRRSSVDPSGSAFNSYSPQGLVSASRAGSAGVSRGSGSTGSSSQSGPSTSTGDNTTSEPRHATSTPPTRLPQTLPHPSRTTSMPGRQRMSLQIHTVPHDRYDPMDPLDSPVALPAGHPFAQRPTLSRQSSLRALSDLR